MRISDWSSDVCSSDLLDCLYAATEVNEWAWWAAVASFSPRAKVPEGRMREGAKPAGASRRKKLPFDDEAKTLIQIGRDHVCTPVTHAHLVCLLLLEHKHKTNHTTYHNITTTKLN